MQNKILFDMYNIDTHGVITNLKTGYILSPTFNDIHNRYKVNLSVYGKKTSFYLHKLVASSFIDCYLDSDEIRFLDNNPKNCDLSNLCLYRLCMIYPK